MLKTVLGFVDECNMIQELRFLEFDSVWFGNNLLAFRYICTRQTLSRTRVQYCSENIV
jgi:hypothetical protein